MLTTAITPHTDDDAKHGQRRSHFVSRQRSQRKPECTREIHGSLLISAN